MCLKLAKMYGRIMFLAALLLFKGCAGLRRNNNEGKMRYALDGMQKLMEGGGNFNQETYSNMLNCFEKFDQDLLVDQDAEWQVMMDLANRRGLEWDRWERCEDLPQDYEHKWKEFNCTLQEQGNMPIYEPCYYASNMAYYHSMIDVCMREKWDMPHEYVLGFVRTFTYLAHGSSFGHGSETEVGFKADTTLNDLFVYLGYQAAVSGLEPLNNSILHELSKYPRSKTALETAASLRTIFLDQPIDDWESALYGVDVPKVYEGMCAYLVFGLSLFLDSEELTSTLGFMQQFLKLDAKTSFCFDTALPVIDRATSRVHLGGEVRENLFKGMMATLMKFLFAAVWQEQIVVNDMLEQPLINQFGASFLPIFNDLMNYMMPPDLFPHFNIDFQHGHNVYPGETWCNPSSNPHAKWHLQTGVALADFAHLSNFYYKVIHDPGSFTTTVTTEDISKSIGLQSLDITLLMTAAIIIMTL